MFLLHGDTGAGKTTVLDAVAFALFGTVPGVRGEVMRLRCDYAEPNTPTVVTLEFTVQGHRLRLTRSPEYERVKRHGDGVTVQRARASLTWVGAAPSGHSPDGLTRIDEVARTVHRLLGMNAAQFFQVVLLPQGEFARFLRAETSEREQLLERLFGTERFADVEQWFRDTRQTRGHAVQDLRQQVRELVARVAQAAGEEPPSDEGSPEDAPGMPWLGAVRARLADEAVLAGKFDLQARDARDRAEVAYRHPLALAEQVRRVRAAHATLAELTASADERQAWANELTAARRAVPVLAAHRAATRTAQEVATSSHAANSAAQMLRSLPDHGVDWPALIELPDVRAVLALRDVAGRLRDEAGELRPLLTETERQRVDEVRLIELVERERTAENTVAGVDELLTGLPGRTTAARAALDEAHRAAGQVAGLTDRVAELDALHRDATRRRRADPPAAVRHRRCAEPGTRVLQRRRGFQISADPRPWRPVSLGMAAVAGWVSAEASLTFGTAGIALTDGFL